AAEPGAEAAVAPRWCSGVRATTARLQLSSLAFGPRHGGARGCLGVAPMVSAGGVGTTPRGALVSGGSAPQLAGLCREVVDRHPVSEVAQVELSAASASGRAARLLICQCDTDGLQLLSFFRRWWVVDAAGLHADVMWPLTREAVRDGDGEAEFPFVKFAT